MTVNRLMIFASRYGWPIWAGIVTKFYARGGRGVRVCTHPRSIHAWPPVLYGNHFISCRPAESGGVRPIFRVQGSLTGCAGSVVPGKSWPVIVTSCLLAERTGRIDVGSATKPRLGRQIRVHCETWISISSWRPPRSIEISEAGRGSLHQCHSHSCMGERSTSLPRRSVFWAFQDAPELEARATEFTWPESGAIDFK